MKTHPHLLVRDALAGCFVAACGGDPAARETVRRLADWGKGTSPEGAPIDLSAEDGTALFGEDGELAPRFAALGDYTRDRARRYEAALSWIDAPDPLEAARAAWDAGLFFEVHEILEPVWLEAQGERRTVLQGLIMAGAALHHLTERNPAGARGLLREAARRLESAPHALPYDLSAFAGRLESLADQVDAGRIEQASQIDDLPRLAART